MILIQSNEQDASTSTVCEWIDYLGGEFYRLNGEDFLASKNEFCFELNDTEETYSSTLPMGLKDVSSVWYRRTGSPDEFKDLLKEIKDSPAYEDDFVTGLHSSLKEEFKSISAAYRALWNKKRLLGNYDQGSINKFEALNKAKEAGLQIPATIITGQKKDVVKFQKKNLSGIITKAACEGLSVVVDGKFVMQYTEEVTPETVASLPEQFFPTLFQEKLDKSVELRIFYLDGVCYSMAIFSQLDAQTSVDFRKYNHTHSNRMIPYKLPKEIEDKIDVFMKSVFLNTGSLDIIRTIDKRYVFLEVNPVGQFGMVSSPCNYFLEKKIAQFLMAS